MEQRHLGQLVICFMADGLLKWTWLWDAASQLVSLYIMTADTDLFILIVYSECNIEFFSA